MFKRCKVVLFRTLKEANITIIDNRLAYSVIAKVRCNTDGFHIYITSNDKIEDGDWYMFDVGYACGIDNTSRNYKEDNCEKIIATTDISIKIKSEQAGDNTWFNSYPRPSDSFISKYIEEYNKGNIITDVMVKYQTLYEIELLVDTKDFKKGSYIRGGKCISKNDFSAGKKRFIELHGSRSNLDIAIDTNSIRALNKLYFKDIEFIEPKINPKDNTITIKKIKDSWNREEVEELCLKFFNAGSMYLATEGKVYPQSDSFEEVKKKLL